MIKISKNFSKGYTFMLEEHSDVEQHVPCVYLVNEPFCKHPYQDLSYGGTAGDRDHELTLSSPEKDLGSSPVRIKCCLNKCQIYSSPRPANKH